MPSRLERRILGLLSGALCAAPLTAAAQVNVEPLRQQVAERGFSARLAGSLTGYAGNTQGVQLASSAFVGGRYTEHLIYGAGSASYTRLNEVISVAKWFGHLRYNYELEPWLFWADRQDRLDPNDQADSRIHPQGTGGYAVANLRAGWQPWPSTRLQLDLRNLLDKAYREHGSGIDGAGFGVGVSAELRFN